MAYKYSIVHFLDEDTVEIVPVTWIKVADDKTECFWPLINFPTKLIKRAAFSDTETYSLHAYRIMQTYDKISYI